MYMSKISLSRRPEFFNLIQKKGASDSYAVHQLLWDLFPNDGTKKRDFLFHKHENSGLPQFFIVSGTEPIAYRGINVETKLYTPKLKSGQQLAFTLVANPVVARKTEGKRHSIKHDVWMDAKKQAKDMNLNLQEQKEYCEKKTKEWLISRAEKHGFSVGKNSIIIDGYLQHHLYKRNNPKPLRFSSVHFEGILTVIDPEIFCNTLYYGIGKSKAFGCGLLLVKRI